MTHHHQVHPQAVGVLPGLGISCKSPLLLIIKLLPTTFVTISSLLRSVIMMHIWNMLRRWTSWQISYKKGLWFQYNNSSFS